ncbi:hypothetical protein MKZ38_006005 [Zalerion maritima]|uniref:F-box domain-containing protein n=1 Tax=Zalerion maritima TaxID=339359 RepID=A0AAD5WNY2_9PEZI|nr:hypothetical protein MKZ38_006005 [Zalerion maritima]
MTCLLELPTEIIEGIAAWLSTRSLWSLRLTCSRLYAQTSHPFARLLPCIRTDFTSESLPIFERVAQNELLRRGPRTLRVCWVYQDTNNARIPYGAGYHWDRDEENCLDMSQPIVTAMKDWLSTSLVNCRSFEITDDNLSSPYFELDATPTGIAPTDVLAMLFYIISETELPIKSLAVSMLRSKMEPEPALIPPRLYSSGPFLKSWGENLRDLSLSWDLVRPGSVDLTVQLLSTATNLHCLKLRLHGSHEAVENALVQAATVDNLPRLKALHIQHLWHVSSHPLLEFASRFSGSLQELEIGYVFLWKGNWGHILHPGKNLFRDLRHIKILQCSEPGRQGLIDVERFYGDREPTSSSN